MAGDRSAGSVSKRFLLRHNASAELKVRFLSLLHRRHRESVEEFWALKDVSLRIERGEAVGLVGRNGSGKSTFLKLVAAIHRPTSGRLLVARHARICSMIELGVGFHPELTGRENMFLNAAIHGLTAARSSASTSGIVSYSGLGALHRRPDQELLVGHVHAAGLRHCGEPRSRHPAARRDLCRRRCRFPAAVHRHGERSSWPGQDDDLRLALAGRGARHLPPRLRPRAGRARVRRRRRQPGWRSTTSCSCRGPASARPFRAAAQPDTDGGGSEIGTAPNEDRTGGSSFFGRRGSSQAIVSFILPVRHRSGDGWRLFSASGTTSGCQHQRALSSSTRRLTFRLRGGRIDVRCAPIQQPGPLHCQRRSQGCSRPAASMPTWFENPDPANFEPIVQTNGMTTYPDREPFHYPLTLVLNVCDAVGATVRRGDRSEPRGISAGHLAPTRSDRRERLDGRETGVSTSLPRVSVLVLNLNGRQYLDACLSSLEAQAYPRDRFEIVVVDNGSADGSIAFVRERYPRTRVLGFESNRGFCAPYNAAVQSVATADFVALLNNDTRVDPHWLGRAGRRPPIGTAQPRSRRRFWIGPARRSTSSAARRRSSATPGSGTSGGPPRAPTPKGRCCFPCAGSALFSRAAFLDAGGFDEDFFAYFEDVDLGWRLNLFGERVVLAPRAVTYHRLHGTSSRVGVRTATASPRAQRAGDDLQELRGRDARAGACRRRSPCPFCGR